MWMGPFEPGKSVFPTEAEARACWMRNRDFMLERYGSDGKRPFYWWQFEAETAGIKFKFPGDWDRQEQLLYQAGVLSEQEREQLTTHWRKLFDEAQALRSLACKRALRRSGIPQSLLMRWTKERRTGGNPPHAAENPPPDAA
jgi:hypothetical protein